MRKKDEICCAEEMAGRPTSIFETHRAKFLSKSNILANQRDWHSASILCILRLLLIDVQQFIRLFWNYVSLHPFE